MDKEFLKNAILKMLPTSTIPEEDKKVVQILLPVMEIVNLEGTYNALKVEQERMSQLNEKQKRVELKYKVMIEKLSSIERNKQKEKMPQSPINKS